jgi:hypothetical protein
LILNQARQFLGGLCSKSSKNDVASVIAEVRDIENSVIAYQDKQSLDSDFFAQFLRAGQIYEFERATLGVFLDFSYFVLEEIAKTRNVLVALLLAGSYDRFGALVPMLANFAPMLTYDSARNRLFEVLRDRPFQAHFHSVFLEFVFEFV